MHSTTPATIGKHLQRLATRILRGGTFVYVPVIAEPSAQINECFLNVEAQIRKHGGRTIFGWQIWEWPNVLVEAEFHAVWQNPEGELIDITPKEGRESRILFLPDSSRVYTGRPIDNIRVPLRDEPLIRHFIVASEEYVRIMSSGERADQYGYVSVPVEEIEPVIRKKIFLQEMLSRGMKSHDLCLCGSGSKYKRCCGRQFD